MTTLWQELERDPNYIADVLEPGQKMYILSYTDGRTGDRISQTVIGGTRQINAAARNAEKFFDAKNIRAVEIKQPKAIRRLKGYIAIHRK